MRRDVTMLEGTYRPWRGRPAVTGAGQHSAAKKRFARARRLTASTGEAIQIPDAGVVICRSSRTSPPSASGAIQSRPGSANEIDRGRTTKSTFKSIMGIENDRTNPGAASRRIVAAGLAVAAVLAVAAGAPRPAYADAPPTPPVSKCSDFGCKQ